MSLEPPQLSAPHAAPAELLPLTYIGAHFSLCPVEIRELWTAAFDSRQGREALSKQLRVHFTNTVPGFVPIFTCNRFDICLHGAVGEAEVVAFFESITADAQKQTGRKLSTSARKVLSSPEKLRKTLRIKQGVDAVALLFRVACSLDSLVLGEPHILGQLKEQYLVAREMGLSTREMESYFSRCFSVAKQVRTQTDLGRSAVSIGHAAVLLVTRIFDNLSHHSALVVGAGEMGRLSAQHLLNHNVHELTVANRTEAHAHDLIRELGEGKASSLETALSQLKSFDIVIVATASRNYLIGPEHFANMDRERGGRAAVVVDISVPRNVDPVCADASDNLFLFDVDDLDKVMEKNRERRKEAAAHAERIIYDDVRQFLQLQIQRDNLQHVARFHRLVRHFVKGEVKKSMQSRSRLNAQTPDVVADAVAKKLVSHVALLAKQGVRLEAGLAGEALDTLFRLEQLQLLEPEEKKVISLQDQNNSKGEGFAPGRSSKGNGTRS